MIVMVCTVTDGSNAPLAFLRKPNKPMCFRLVGCKGKLPISYANQG